MPIESLYLVPSEDSADENGQPLFCVFNRQIDAITFVGREELALLKKRGIRTLASLPEESA
jgi:hypothetical protein